MAESGNSEGRDLGTSVDDSQAEASPEQTATVLSNAGFNQTTYRNESGTQRPATNVYTVPARRQQSSDNVRQGHMPPSAPSQRNTQSGPASQQGSWGPPHSDRHQQRDPATSQPQRQSSQAAAQNQQAAASRDVRPRTTTQTSPPVTQGATSGQGESLRPAQWLTLKKVGRAPIKEFPENTRFDRGIPTRKLIVAYILKKLANLGHSQEDLSIASRGVTLNERERNHTMIDILEATESYYYETEGNVMEVRKICQKAYNETEKTPSVFMKSEYYDLLKNFCSYPTRWSGLVMAIHHATEWAIMSFRDKEYDLYYDTIEQCEDWFRNQGHDLWVKVKGGWEKCQINRNDPGEYINVEAQDRDFVDSDTRANAAYVGRRLTAEYARILMNWE